MKKTKKRILVLCLTAVILLTSVSSVAAASIYYYFGYYYTYVNNKNVSLHGIDHEEYDMLFVPDTLNNLKLVDIENNAFSNDTEIRLIEFAGAVNLERIGSFAFSGCTNVKGEIKIPSNVVTIEVAAFQNCSSLNSVIYNAACGYVPNQCFKGCTSLSSVTLNDSVNSIGNYAFADCVSLQKITIPKTVNSISNSAFSGDSDIVICCYRGSYAEQFAKENGLEYDILDPLIGDVNGDEEITIMDATIIQKKSLGIATADVVSNYDVAADVSKDGFVNIRDVTLIQMYVAGIITEF